MCDYCNSVVHGPHVFETSGVIKFGKLRDGCRQKLYRIAEEKHAKTRVGTADDGIAYQGNTQHLQFQLVFKEESQAEAFRTAVKQIPRLYRSRTVEFPTGIVVVPDVTVVFQPIQKRNWRGNLDLIEEDMDQRIESGTNYEMDSLSQTSDVSVNPETKLRLLEREDSPFFFRQKPEKCHIVRQTDDPGNANNPNNIIYMSCFLHQQLDMVNSTEGIPQFYFRYVAHSEQPHQGVVDENPVPVFETTLEIVFKDEVAKKELSNYFNNPTDVDLTVIRVIAYFPNPAEFDYFARTKAEETIARWASYDALLNG